jgi:hypothetical protein
MRIGLCRVAARSRARCANAAALLAQAVAFLARDQTPVLDEQRSWQTASSALSQLLSKASAGRSFVDTRGGRPMEAPRRGISHARSWRGWVTASWALVGRPSGRRAGPVLTADVSSDGRMRAVAAAIQPRTWRAGRGAACAAVRDARAYDGELSGCPVRRGAVGAGAQAVGAPRGRVQGLAAAERRSQPCRAASPSRRRRLAPCRYAAAPDFSSGRATLRG